ncbi:MAG: hypothetical protein JWM95_4509 [Gemmatimonadetes bacterium]|nr:hypothetical protein [Gemmatimonadota bacterium]
MWSLGCHDAMTVPGPVGVATRMVNTTVDVRLSDGRNMAMTRDLPMVTDNGAAVATTTEKVGEQAIGEHLAVSASGTAKRGIAVERFFDSLTNTHYAARLTRDQDGAPYSKVEIAVGHDVLAVMQMTWTRDADGYRLSRRQTDRYENGKLAIRTTMAETTTVSVGAGNWRSVPSDISTKSSASIGSVPASANALRILDCDDPDSWMDEGCWGYTGGGLGGGGGGREAGCDGDLRQWLQPAQLPQSRWPESQQALLRHFFPGGRLPLPNS